MHKNYYLHSHGESYVNKYSVIEAHPSKRVFNIVAIARILDDMIYEMAILEIQYKNINTYTNIFTIHIWILKAINLNFWYPFPFPPSNILNIFNIETVRKTSHFICKFWIFCTQYVKRRFSGEYTVNKPRCFL